MVVDPLPEANAAPTAPTGLTADFQYGSDVSTWTVTWDAGDYGRAYYVEADYNYGRLWKLTDGWRGEIPFYSVVYGGAVHMIDLVCWLRNATESACDDADECRNSIATHADVPRGWE